MGKAHTWAALINHVSGRSESERRVLRYSILAFLVLMLAVAVEGCQTEYDKVSPHAASPTHEGVKSYFLGEKGTFGSEVVEASAAKSVARDSVPDSGAQTSLGGSPPSSQFEAVSEVLSERGLHPEFEAIEPNLPREGKELASETPPAGARPYPLGAPSARAPNGQASGQPRGVRPSRPTQESFGRLPILLSAGVAIPQTLPTGTAMGFSVDYRWVEGRPDPSTTYFWVIESAGAPPLRQPVRLQQQGTLQGFALELRPEHGPFHTQIEDAHGRRLSSSVPLR